MLPTPARRRGLARLCLLFAPFLLLRAAEPALPDGLYAQFTTPRGEFVAELFPARAHLMCVNFTGLAEGTLAPRNGRPFYSGLTWYRVVPGFVLQSGNPGLKDTDDEKEPIPHHFPDEFVPGLSHDAAGILSMANAGPDTNSCEFFLTLAPVRRLDYLHSVFGHIVRGLDVLPRVRQDDAVAIKILRIGAAAEAFRNDAATFARLAAAAKKFAGAREPGPSAHFDDPDHLLPTEPPRARYFNYKLANVERTTGLRVVARAYAKSPPAAADVQPGAYMRALAGQLGTAQAGALAVYFADEDEWRVWIGDALIPRFTGRPGTVQTLTENGAIHDVKEAFLQAAQATGIADFQQQQEILAAAGRPAAPPGQRIKLQIDAVLDGLIFKFEPRPRVLIIGDSISLGYTPQVARLLEMEAEVVHHPGNAQHTGTGLQKIDAWLGAKPWDAIHFNWGLWDLCYRHPEARTQGNRDKLRGTLTTSLAQYEENLEQLVQRLEGTGARLIWAHTTTVPADEAGRFAGDEKHYNEAAARVMRRHGIPINDLQAVTAGFAPGLFVGPGDVHYTPEGYAILAREVAAAIRTALSPTPGRRRGPTPPR